jgi:hypothetical protein
MDEYRKYLATKVINEDVIVSTRSHEFAPELDVYQINYRQLSRALKVHTHLAKQYEISEL